MLLSKLYIQPCLNECDAGNRIRYKKNETKEDSSKLCKFDQYHKRHAEIMKYVSDPDNKRDIQIMKTISNPDKKRVSNPENKLLEVRTEIDKQKYCQYENTDVIKLERYSEQISNMSFQYLPDEKDSGLVDLFSNLKTNIENVLIKTLRVSISSFGYQQAHEKTPIQKIETPKFDKRTDLLSNFMFLQGKFEFEKTPKFDRRTDLLSYFMFLQEQFKFENLDGSNSYDDSEASPVFLRTHRSKVSKYNSFLKKKSIFFFTEHKNVFLVVVSPLTMESMRGRCIQISFTPPLILVLKEAKGLGNTDIVFCSSCQAENWEDPLLNNYGIGQAEKLGNDIRSYYEKQTSLEVVNLVLFVSDQRKTQQTALLAAKEIISQESFRKSPISKLLSLIAPPNNFVKPV